MKTQDTPDKTTARPRLSLEQKVKLLVRKARAAERRRKRASQAPCRSGFRGMRILMLAVALLTSLAFSFGVRAMTPASTFEKANASFASGNFRAAIEEYEAILEHDGFSAPVLFNLGKAAGKYSGP